MATADSVDAYIAAFPPEVRQRLSQARAVIHRAAPGLGERISYGIPTFTLAGRYVVYLAGHKQHLGIYPVPHGDAELQRDLEPYRAGKGTLRFRHTEPLPEALIERVVVALRKAAGDRSGES